MNGTIAGERDVQEIISKSRAEFERRRWILITNVPDNVDLEDLRENFLHGFDIIDLRIEKNSAFVLLETSDQAVNAINILNGQSYHGFVVGVCLAPPNSLLFVGNLPFEFTEEQFRNLMSPFGPIERLLLVRSMFTGESKGYGFVDYINRESAMQAKQQLMSKGSKYVGGRILRVDFAEANLLTYEDLHSKTLFVDRLPRDFTNADMLRELFSQSGTVTFAQVAVNNQTGVSRGFAFVDYVTAEEAERGQKSHNGALLEDSNIRVAYGTPGRTGASILGGHHGASMGSQGPRPRGPFSTVPQGAEVMGPRGPPPLMAPRPLMGAELWQQMPRGPFGKSPRPLMRPGAAGPRPMMGRARGPSTGGPRHALLGHGPRPLLGRPVGPRPLMRPAGPRGFVGMGVGGPPGRPMGPRGAVTQPPRPLMDFGDQTVFSSPDQMQAVPAVAEPPQQYVGDSLPTLMGEPVNSYPLASDPAVFGQTVQTAIAQPQEAFVQPAPQQGMMVPSQPQPGTRPAVPQMVQVQPIPGTPPVATGTLPTATQTQMAVVPQAQPSVLMSTQQQHIPNNQVLYASPGTIPVQGVVPQVVAQNPLQYQPGMVAATPGVPVAGQVDVNTASSYGVPAVQPVAQGDPSANATVSSGYVVISADSTQQSGFYTPQDAQSYPVPQFTLAGQTAVQQPLVQIPASVPSGTALQAQAPSSQPSAVPMVTPQTQQYQWYQQVTPVVSNPAVSTPQLLQNTSFQGGTQWPQGELVATPQPLMTVQPGTVYGQYPQQTPQYQTQQPQQTAAVPAAETVFYYQQPQMQPQQQQQQQPGVIPNLMDTAPGAPQPGYPSVTLATGVATNTFPIFPNASVAPQHSAPPVVYNSAQASQLVAGPGGPPQLSQKRAADGDPGQQGPASFYDANKRLRF